MARERLGYRGEIQFPTQLSLHRRHRPRRDSTRHDQIEVTEIGVHIQCEAVRRDKPRYVHTDGGDLRLSCVGTGLWPVLTGSGPVLSGAEGTRSHIVSPDPRQSRDTLGRNPKIRARPNQNFFQSPDVIDRTQSLTLSVGGGVAAKIEDRVADKLSWAVESHVAATIAFVDFYPAQGQLVRWQKNVCCFRVAPQRDHRSVLEQ